MMKKTTTMVVAGLALCLGASQVCRADDAYRIFVAAGDTLEYHGYMGESGAYDEIIFYVGGTVNWVDNADTVYQKGFANVYDTTTLNMHAAPEGVPQPGIPAGLRVYEAATA